jgi:hypothetical protein
VPIRSLQSAPMSTRTLLRAAVLLTVSLVLTMVSTAAASKGGDKAGDRTPSKVSVQLKGLKKGDLTVGKKIEAVGKLRPFVKGQKVTVILHKGKKTVKRVTVPVRPKGKVGTFGFKKRLVKPGRYSIEAIHNKNATLGGSKTESRRFHINYPNLSKGDESDTVHLFNALLGKQGYVNDENSTYNDATGRAVLAFNKVNGNSRSENADSSTFKKLAKGRGGFKLKDPGVNGKHVEVDLSRQVMVLAKGDDVDEIYSVSTGASVTPTILGKFNFYRKEPGTNSHGMVNSVYFYNGYATHGYASVPDYPASHGCVRSPIPDSLHIYNWIDIGDQIYIYH